MAKQVIVMRKDLNMRKGKMVAQGAHASLGVILSMMPKDGENRILHVIPGTPMDNWINGKFTKVCVSVDSEEELLDIAHKAEQVGLPCKVITDAGQTEFNGVPTITCCAIGPCDEDVIDKVTGHLKLL